VTWEHADLEAVIDSASRGDTAALDELLRRYRPRLIRMIRYRLDPRLHPRVDESDVLQETLIATSGAIRNYVADDCGPFYAWLRRIAWRQLRRLCRQHIETGKRSVDREEFALTNDSRDALCQQLISLSTPSRAAQQAETEQQMYAALDKLAEPDREILVLRYLEQLDSQEIAGVLRTSESTVRMRLMRAVRRIRELLNIQESRP
jgi:RNA polymerase sigma-70 factor (ECF subfamily)